MSKLREELKNLLDSYDSEKKEPKKEDKSVSVDITEKLADKMSALVEAILDKKGFSSPEDAANMRNKLFAENGDIKAVGFPDVSAVEKMTDSEKIVAFYKSMLRGGAGSADANERQIFKALTEGTSADGGYLVPAPLASEIWRILPDLAVMRRIARVVAMTSQTLKLNNLGGRPMMSWTGEYITKTTTSADFGQVTLTARKLAGILPVSTELAQDANVDVVRFITELFAEAIATEEDKAFFTGNGTTQPRGINQETLTTINCGGTVTFDDIIEAIHRLPARNRASRSVAWVGNRNSLHLLRAIKDTTNNYIWRSGLYGRMSGQTETLPDMLYGIPVYEQNDIADKTLYLGDWSYYIIGDRQQITIDSTNIGGEAWRRNSIEIRAEERVDGRAVLTSPFIKVNNL